MPRGPRVSRAAWLRRVLEDVWSLDLRVVRRQFTHGSDLAAAVWVLRAA